LLVVRSHLFTILTAQNLEPPELSKTPGLGFNVSFQKVDAKPGHEAALRPNSLMYQLEQPAANTEPLSWLWMLFTHWSSAVAFTSTTETRWSSIGARSVLATYSI
jgi:hypothetical protein